ncbi:hypothetical protein GQR58_015688 [Nymphon striatum]|nr:hypothetical protein GQR58_015688 [Nymphon striatum]
MIVAGGLGLEVETTDPEIEISMLRSDHEEAETRYALREALAQSWNIKKAIPSKYIPIHEIRNTLSFEQPVLDALLAFHAITGCDTVSYLMGHSKKTIMGCVP